MLLLTLRIAINSLQIHSCSLSCSDYFYVDLVAAAAHYDIFLVRVVLGNVLLCICNCSKVILTHHELSLAFIHSSIEIFLYSVLRLLFPRISHCTLITSSLALTKKESAKRKAHRAARPNNIGSLERYIRLELSHDHGKNGKQSNACASIKKVRQDQALLVVDFSAFSKFFIELLLTCDLGKDNETRWNASVTLRPDIWLLGYPFGSISQGKPFGSQFTCWIVEDFTS